MCPTRPTSNTIIDNIYTNVVNRKVTSGLFITDISDHLPIFSICEEPEKIKRSETVVTKRVISLQARRKFREEIASVNWDSLLLDTGNNNGNNGVSSYNTFSKTLMSIYNSCFPYKQVNVQRRNSKPWITVGLKSACLKKNQPFQKNS